MLTCHTGHDCMPKQLSNNSPASLVTYARFSMVSSRSRSRPRSLTEVYARWHLKLCVDWLKTVITRTCFWQVLVRDALMIDSWVVDVTRLWSWPPVVFGRCPLIDSCHLWRVFSMDESCKSFLDWFRSFLNEFTEIGRGFWGKSTM